MKKQTGQTSANKKRSKNVFMVSADNRTVIRATIAEIKIIKGFLNSKHYTPNKWKIEETLTKLSVMSLILKRFFSIRHDRTVMNHVYDKRKPV